MDDSRPKLDNTLHITFLLSINIIKILYNLFLCFTKVSTLKDLDYLNLYTYIIIIVRTIKPFDNMFVHIQVLFDERIIV